MNTLRELLPFIWPLIVIQVGLMIFALLDLSRRSVTRGPKWVWVLVIVLINTIGPIVYFVIGRDEG
ncbi:MAG: PLD nuclease N-terminal domain-containing protein [Anaerolineae bacterium]|jgi:hypothetical protein